MQYDSIEHNRRWNAANAFGDDGGELWSGSWGGTPYLWLCTILPRIHSYLPADTVLEIAPGYGRCTAFLQRHTRHLIGVDLNEACVVACKERFTAFNHMEFHVNDGKSLPMVRDRSVDFVFSWDSMVHAQPDALIPYMRECARCLKPGGIGFVHHSNLASVLADPGRGSAGAAECGQGRADQVDADAFRLYCEQAGLRVLSQEIIPWGNPAPTDCMTTFSLTDSPVGECIKVVNPAFRSEQRQARLLSAIYGGSRSMAMVKTIQESEGDSVLRETLRCFSVDTLLNAISPKEHMAYLARRVKRKLRNPRAR
jgi:SAM-dependent methyltransferase